MLPPCGRGAQGAPAAKAAYKRFAGGETLGRTGSACPTRMRSGPPPRQSAVGSAGAEAADRERRGRGGRKTLRPYGDEAGAFALRKRRTRCARRKSGVQAFRRRRNLGEDGLCLSDQNEIRAPAAPKRGGEQAHKVRPPQKRRTSVSPEAKPWGGRALPVRPE